MVKIAIVGCGWYGCHIASVLKDIHDITMYEKNNSIFENSSYYNQNRLHLGFHYPRNYATRNLCSRNYERFKNMYPMLIDNMNNNFYAISENSLIDYNTYLSIYNNENFKFELINNDIFNGIDGNLIKVTEQIINSSRAKQYFEEQLKNTNICFNTKIIGYTVTNHNKIILNFDDDYVDATEYDYLLDCSYNQLGLSNKNYIYEITISLVFKKINSVNFDAITIMDGKFSSLYPRTIDEELYTLTDVEFTPLFISNDFKDIEKFIITNDMVECSKNNIINKFTKMYPDFEKNFKYSNYFLSNKTKMLSISDSRDISIERVKNNIITVNCGKIYGIFEFEDYINEMFKNN